MRGTFTLPSGVKFRSASYRRYLLVQQWQGTATVIKRSDKLEITQAQYKRHPDRVIAGDSAIRSRYFIVDTETGETIAQRSEEDFIWV